MLTSIRNNSPNLNFDVSFFTKRKEKSRCASWDWCAFVMMILNSKLLFVSFFMSSDCWWENVHFCLESIFHELAGWSSSRLFSISSCFWLKNFRILNFLPLFFVSDVENEKTWRIRNSNLHNIDSNWYFGLNEVASLLYNQQPGSFPI